ncbi:unnamed protein product [Bursaphelenchus okinawaensis]|uniref:Fungal lipase-type domain-containing protein n=1 Tax=Bursaphelenchus okinawaensis TaxID=465554 RepID=A0A811JSP2_9BILA|nr:unnamed protein product [Bursaphelenchus okinawaensis]CAG9081449.1 unnamed protein product [Bursaphelenchus okinawaensis]
MLRYLSFSFLISIASATSYDDRLADFALDFAAAAYANDPSKCIQKHGLQMAIQTKVACDSTYNQCWAYIAYNETIVVTAVRGTQTRLQLITELVETMSAPKKSFPSGGSVQRYFYIALKTIWKQGFGQKLSNLTKTLPKAHFLFTGHSLGGALASLTSSLFAHNHNRTITSDRISLITFGQPRVGNMDYATGHDELVPRSWRLIHRYDIVAHLPYCYESLFSRQCSSLYNHGPYHHGTEIWYPGEMTNSGYLYNMYRICTNTPLNEDRSCSNSAYIHYNVADHLMYFNKSVSDYGEAGCPV